ncbi:helix-turn-helix domain-containing protein [Aureibacter tunicatorum]|uniref:AraC-like DNA-binding protein n=1 Tax=Aureibacter tunicatorum TaxID=866807 RepID=A0AAE3XSZ4_9BACT|nr:helix-turn-helix domain-containing protein [Aureibacter tunicatorum]MDR6241538.1 AraC-like DNA-binding protein [Aureibacter tunicatorum]BDD07238.1 AraC family transcriptional regulator [Aureibacter tunicatorum]
MSEFKEIKSISELHKILGVSKPTHPAISLVHANQVKWDKEVLLNRKFILDFYMISLKYHDSSMKYGRNYYDFDEGSLVFMAPGQVVEMQRQPSQGMEEGWTLFFHPDLILQSELGKKIGAYSFFSYAINEALHLSDVEKTMITRCVDAIEQECKQNIDRHSQTVIISNLELLLNYCHRYYDRQFYTRSNHQKNIVIEIEELISSYFESEEALKSGILTVKYCADQVHLSPNYLSDLLKKETGKNTQEHIHYHLIEKAKSLLLNSQKSVSEIAYDLGFEYPQYFGNLFKKKTGLSPVEFRKVI